MKEFIDKLIAMLEEYPTYSFGVSLLNTEEYIKVSDLNKIVNRLAEEHKGGWIHCSERLPKVETMVYIVAKRKFCDGSVKYITTTAMYEDGTVLENDSCWRWEDIDGEWDEENDCYIIPEGWWEDKKYNADGELNHAVDDEVIAWQQLPEEYQPPQEPWKDAMMNTFLAGKV